MAAVVASPGTIEQPGPSGFVLQPLPYTLETACPIALPTRAVTGSKWPYPMAGPESAVDEPIQTFLRRRYLETLYLSDLLSPLSAFAVDILRCHADPASSPAIAEHIRPMLLSLSDIEIRQRKTLQQLISAIIAASSSTGTSTAHAILEETARSSGLSAEEVQAVKVGVELRLNSRAASEGANVSARKLGEELERREVLMQIVLLFHYIPHAPAPETETKKRKRHGRKSNAASPAPPAPVYEDPKAAVELLMDRLSVWQAVAELGIGLDTDVERAKGKVRDKEPAGFSSLFRQTWDQVLVPFFLAKQTDLCASFHVKVFGQPMPAKLAVPTTTKVPRKPKLTRARPSSDTLAVPPPLPQPPRQSSRDLSELRSLEPSQSRGQSMRRSMSRTSDQLRRSRSRSIDHAPRDHDRDRDRELLGATAPAAKKTLIRAPSGKALFRGREVGLFRRTPSGLVKPREGLSKDESQKSGLLGRKTSDGAKGHTRRNSADESQIQEAGTTIIFATPAKPRGLSASLFGRRSFQAPHATPIQEEPTSHERIHPQSITETPQVPGRVAETPVQPARVAETPLVASRLSDMPLFTLASRDQDDGDDDGNDGNDGNDDNDDNDDNDNDDDDDGSNDPLADLMVMTDEEDAHEESGARAVVPDTPAR